MGVTLDKLTYDATTPSDGASVAAFLRSGTAALTSTTVGGDEALDINIVQSVSLTVTATNLDIRDLVFATDKVDVSGSSNVAVVDGGGSLTVDAVDLDIRDLTAASDSVAAWTHDGTGNAITSSGGALDVNIQSSDINFNVDLVNSFEYAEDDVHASGAIGAFVLAVANEAQSTLAADGDYTPFGVDTKGRLYVNSTVASPNTAMTHGRKEVSTSALLVAAAANRRVILVQNEGAQAIAVGSSGVTYAAAMPNSTDGIRIVGGANLPLEIGPGLALHAVSASGTPAVRFMQIA